MQALLLAAALAFGAAPAIRVPVKLAAPSAVPRLTLAVVNQTPLTGLALVNPQPLLTLAPQPAVQLSPAVEPGENDGARGPSLLSNLAASAEKLAETPEAELTSSFDGVARSLAGAHYDVFEPGYEARFHLNKGVLQSRIKTRDEKGRAKGISAKNEFANALRIFTAGVRAVEGNWTQGELGDNLETFNELTKAGLGPEQAALGTWTGRQAAKAGFTKAVFLPGGKFMLKHQQPGEYTAMAVLFVRPEDHHVDRRGGVWRRTKNRGGWERWQSEEGKVAQILRKKTDEGLGVWEFEGDGEIAPGTAGRAWAVFSAKDGKLTANVEMKDSKILRAKDEYRRALAELKAASIKSSWTFGDNLAEFNRLTAHGVPPKEAALGTWTGKLAAEAGFTKVTFGEQTLKNLATQKSGQYMGVAVHFTRP